jgi:hypothetical protein
MKKIFLWISFIFYGFTDYFQKEMRSRASVNAASVVQLCRTHQRKEARPARRDRMRSLV